MDFESKSIHWIGHYEKSNANFEMIFIYKDKYFHTFFNDGK